MLLTEQGCARLRTCLIIMQIPRGYNKRFFLIARGICIIIRPVRSLAQPCSVNNTFLASGKSKNGVFTLRIAHIALFYTINVFFLIAPRDLHYY